MAHTPKNSLFIGESSIDCVRYDRLTGQIFQVKKTFTDPITKELYYSHAYWTYFGKRVRYYAERVDGHITEGEVIQVDNR